MIDKLKKNPYFIALFPFVFYGIVLVDYIHYIELSSIVKGFSIFYIIILGLHWVLKKIFKTNKNAISITFFFSLLFYCFFGNLKTFLMQQSFTKYISTYPILLSIIIIIIAIIYFLSKKYNKVQQQLFEYANYLCLLLLVLQTFLLTKEIIKPQPKITEPITFEKTNKTINENIYFILLDEYAGNQSLKEYFKYDNSAICNHLKQLGFYVADTIYSNNNQTINSMNSILNMQYLNYQATFPWKNYNSLYLNSFVAIKNNLLTQFLKKVGFSINNFSIFDIKNNNNNYNFKLLFKAKQLIYKNLFHNKIYDDLSWIFCIGKNKIEFIYNYRELSLFHQNNMIIEKTIQHSKNKTKNNFLYSHLLIPHEPFYTDSSGKLYDNIIYNTNQFDSLYLNYLKYGNTVIKKMTDSISYYDSNAIIIIMSDHGYKCYPDSFKKLIFNNFLAIKFPDRNYVEIQKVKSNVNVFRVILNQYFNQHLPLLKDSLFYMEEYKNKLTKHELYN